jgi:hypothetical protein
LDIVAGARLARAMGAGVASSPAEGVRRLGADAFAAGSRLAPRVRRGLTRPDRPVTADRDRPTMSGNVVAVGVIAVGVIAVGVTSAGVEVRVADIALAAGAPALGIGSGVRGTCLDSLALSCLPSSPCLPLSCGRRDAAGAVTSCRSCSTAPSAGRSPCRRPVARWFGRLLTGSGSRCCFVSAAGAKRGRAAQQALASPPRSPCGPAAGSRGAFAAGPLAAARS